MPAWNYRVFSDGGYTTGAWYWSRTGTSGVVNPTTAGLTDEATEGENTGWINSGSVSNTLTELYDSTQSYLLTLDVVSPLGLSSAGYIVRLYAGATVIAEQSAPSIAADTIQHLSLQSAVGDAALDGQALRIEITKTNGVQLIYDNVGLMAQDGANPDWSFGPHSVVIENAGLERESLNNDGDHSLNAPGWIASGDAGDFNPGVADVTGEATEGENVGWINSGSVTNTLTDAYDSTQSYDLLLDIGSRVGLGTAGYTVRLYAGATIIAEMSGTTIADAPMEHLSLQSGPGDAVLNGEALRIEISKTAGVQLNYDNVSILARDANIQPVFDNQADGAILEVSEGDSFVFDFDATDPDGQTVSYVLSGDDAAQFTIDAAGALSFAPVPDFETPDDADGDNAYQVTVTAQDTDGATQDLAVTVNLLDLEESAPGSQLTVDGVQRDIFAVTGQDRGFFQVSPDGTGLELEANTWKYVSLDVTITVDTILSFDFQSDVEGEIHAIGFDTDEGLSPEWLFQLEGTQIFGSQAYADQYTIGSGVRHYDIAVGDHFTGTFDRLVFVMDNDADTTTDVNANSVFQNIDLYESI